MNNYRPHNVIREDRSDGSILLRAQAPLTDYANRTTDWLDAWARDTPNAVFLAERSGKAWREITYAQAKIIATSMASGLLELGLNKHSPIMIISGNSVDHGLLALAAQYVAVPIVPIAEQYALIPEARSQIDYIASVVNPGLVFGEDGDVLKEVLERRTFNGVHRLVSRGGSDFLKLESLQNATLDISERHATVGPDTIAKILMTSGSTSLPKGVPTSHRMMCVNQSQITYALPFLLDKPPCIVDWLPWNHVFGGSHNFNMMLAHGGSLYIDSGKPAPHLIGKTLENLRLKTGTLAFNVPVGFAMIRDALKADETLQRAYFENLDMLFYAGASLPQDVWTDLEAMARAVRGDMPLFNSSWGLTETAPAVLLQHQPTSQSGVVGVPLPGTEVKLIPDADMRYEVRLRGENIFSEYFNQPDATASAFDDEGFFKTGDAMLFVDPEDMNLGLKFDGRLSEDFKLLTGTWVRAASLRLTLLNKLKELASDVIITGADRLQVGVFIIPSASARAQRGTIESNGALLIPSLTKELQHRLSSNTGSSSSQVSRILILAEPASLADGEITAKGNINFRKLLQRRANLLERLYNDEDPATLLIDNP